MKTVFIVNPNGKKDGLYRVMQEIKKNYPGQQVIIEKTQSSEHVQFLARKYALKTEEEIHMYVCGGDGTLHHIVNGLAGAKHIKLSILPVGTGNDFVKYFEDLTIEDFLDLSNYKDGVEMNCDLLKCGGEYAINTISFGFDVNVAQHVNEFRNILPLKGIMAYYLGVLRNLMGPISQEYSIQIDDQRIKDIFSFVVFTNARFYGGGYKPCPNALIDDGFMDVCLIKDIKRTQILGMASKYQKGEHVNYPELASLFQAKTCHLDTENKEIMINLDGEIHPIKNPTIEIEPNMIRLLLPKKK